MVRWLACVLLMAAVALATAGTAAAAVSEPASRAAAKWAALPLALRTAFCRIARPSNSEECTARLSRSVRGLGSANVTVAPTAMDLLRGAVQEDQDEDVLRALERVNAMVKPLPPAPRSKPAPPPAKAKRDLPPSPPPQPVVRCDGSEPHPAPPDDPCHGKPPAQLAAEARAMQAAIEQASVAAMAERQRRWLAEARAIFKRFSGPDGSWTRGNRVGVHDLNLDVAAAAAAVSAPVHRA